MAVKPMTKKDVMSAIGNYTPGAKSLTVPPLEVPAPSDAAKTLKTHYGKLSEPTEREIPIVPSAGAAAPDYDATWIPPAFDDNVAMPVPKFGPLDRRIEVLVLMKPGQSFALPAHLVDLWRETARKLRIRNKGMAEREYSIRTVDELFSRMWRVK